MFEKYFDYLAHAPAVTPAVVTIICAYTLYVVFIVSPAMNTMLRLVNVCQENSKGILHAVVPDSRAMARTSH
jgi:hypothetical protein